jgi:lysozyme family protein
MAEYLKAYDITLKHEGGYANNPNDKGGETYCGISRKFFPNWEGWVSIDNWKKGGGDPKNLKYPFLEKEIQSFYKINFWDTLLLDKFNDQNIANELFDTGVNMGVKTAAEMVQLACNLLNKQGKLYPDIDVDGKIGEKQSLKTINNHPDKRKLYNLLNILQGARYVELTKKTPSQETFLNGWLERVDIIKKN